MGNTSSAGSEMIALPASRSAGVCTRSGAYFAVTGLWVPSRTMSPNHHIMPAIAVRNAAGP
jgi:hypothetical protein